MVTNGRPHIILAGPPGANLGRQAYPVLRSHGVPVRMVIVNRAALELVIASNSHDWLLLMPDLYPSMEEAKEFLERVSGTMPVAVVLPPAWAGSAETFGKHPQVKAVFQRPCGFDEIARKLVKLYEGGFSPPAADLTDESWPAPSDLEPTAWSAKPAVSAHAPASVHPAVPVEAPAAAVPSPQADVAAPAAPTAPPPIPKPVAKPAPLSHAPAPLANVLAIWSGMAGGTGKSTIAANLALRLARADGAAILLAFGGSARHMRVGGEGAGAFATRPGENGFQDGLQAWRELPVMPPPADFHTLARMEALGAGTAGSVTHLIRFAADRYDLVIVDCPTGTGEWALQPVMVAGTILLVSRPAVADQTEIARALNLLDRIRRPRNGERPYRLHIALNDALPGDPDTDVFRQGLATLLGRQAPEVAARLPHHPNVRRAQNEALPLVEAEGLESVTAGIDLLAAPWLPAESVRDNGKGPDERTGREFDLLGLVKVKVVD